MDVKHGMYGVNTPSIYIQQYTPSVSKFIFTSSVDGNPYYSYRDEYPIPLNEWVDIKVSQKRYGDKYWYAIEVNGKLGWNVINTKPKAFENVRVFSNFYSSHSGALIRNAYIDIGKDE